MAQVSLILLDDVENLGLAGDTVNVAPGYARNFLLPRKLAAKATPGALRQIESRKAAIAARRAQELEKAKALAEELGKIEISIAMQATEDDQLF
ncbi:MAG: 50S ribosomal protein L9, partial [Lentisphaeria bacterium]|nr:50S ribosomal protein L9 [Lentisphaeria bacterium]